MRKSCIFNHLLPLAIFAIGATFHSCKDDVFDADVVKAAYEDKFPVKDIDPDMEWRTTDPVAVKISVFQDAGVDYTIRIYDGNPLVDNSTALLLTEGTASNTLPFVTTMDCPSILKEVFVCCIDAQNRAIVKYATITNNHLKVTFGAPAMTRAMTRGVEIPAITTYTPPKTATQIEAMLGQATEITTTTNFTEGGVYKISKGTTYSGNVQKHLNANNPTTLIVAGEWKPTSGIELEDGYILYVLDGGSINLADKTLIMKNSTHYVVYAGGKIHGTSNSNINITNASNQIFNYNAGTIEVHKIENGGGAPTLYNDRTGVYKVPEFQLSTTNSQLINHGTAELGNTHDNLTIENGNTLAVSSIKGKLINWGKATVKNTDTNCEISNACYLNVTGKFKGDLTMGNSCAASINEYGSAEEWDKNLVLGKNSMITIQKAYFSNTTFRGSNEPSLIKVKELNFIQLNANAATGEVFFEFEKIPSNSSEGWRHLSALTYFSKWGEAPVIIPAGDCISTGNTPGTGSGTPDNPIRYTYAFEDNYPLVGDYDFNDLVLDISLSHEREKKTHKVEKTHINVTLAALGATKQLGAGLRLIGIKSYNISEIKTSGNDKDRFEVTLRNQNSLITYSDNHMEAGNDNDVVIPLFGNAHQVYENIEAGKMVNTDPAGLKSRTYTYEITIEYEDSYQSEQPLITKDNLDFFICYHYKHMDKRMEVHLYEFWNQGATAAGTVQKENLDLAGNNTWAICVPNYRYPKEKINICNEKESSDCAYPEFLNWVRDRSVSQDWYLHPNENNVYR